MKCDLCGTKEVTCTARVEGVLVQVCDACARFGTVVKMAPKPTLQKRAAEEKKETKDEVIEIVVPDYAARIRKAREKSGILPKDFAKQVAEKESVILHLEAGKMLPNLELARKLERALHITLIERIEAKEEKMPVTARDGMTLGDLIKP
jgi:putative transcription factor